MDHPDLMDWIAVALGVLGGASALVASILGIRMKSGVALTETGEYVSGTQAIVDDIRKASWVLLGGSIAVLAGVAIQIVLLMRRY